MNSTQIGINFLATWMAVMVSASSHAAEPASVLPSAESLIFAIDKEGDAALQEEEEAKSPWSGSIGLALNGNSSNTVTFNIMLNADVKRETPMEIFTSSIMYMFKYDGGDVTDNNGLFTISQTWNLAPDSPWNLWVQGSYQYDATEGYISRITGYGGAGYRVVNTKDLKINVKGGLGAQWDYRGNTAVQPQTIFEITSDWSIVDGFKFTSNASIANNVMRYNSYLLRGRAQLEAAIKAVKGLALTVGVRDEYNSTPSAGSSYNQLWYWVGLQYSF